VVGFAASEAEFLLAAFLLLRGQYTFQGFILVMLCLLPLVLVFGLRSVRKLCLLLIFIRRVLSITFMIRRLRLRRVLFLVFVFLDLGLIKVLLVLNLSLPFLISEANHPNGFLIILFIMSPAQLN
jgi:hypothetical protein